MTMKLRYRTSSTDFTSHFMVETAGGEYEILCGIVFAAMVFVRCVFWQLAAIVAAGFRATIVESFRPQTAWDLSEPL